MKKLRKIAYIIVWILLTGGTLAGLGFVNAEQKKTTCTGTSVRLFRPGPDVMVEESTIQSLLSNGQQEMKGSPVASLNTRLLEDKIQKIPAVQNAEVFVTPSGKLHVKAWQREPVVKIHNQWNQSFFMDTEGTTFRITPPLTARVLVVSGYISYRFSDETGLKDLADSLPGARQLKDLYQLSRYIYQHPHLKSLFTQIYVNADHEIELIPAAGTHTVLMGTTERMEEKLLNLLIFYNKASLSPEFNQYRKLNLKYRNQVICSKNE